ncbi:MAG TPA: hypothetical protein VFE46_19470 [Pirellulales bacterium]|jgi:hypothetical protein|nr:hypothetical protein [Pirellulales bacterium]
MREFVKVICVVTIMIAGIAAALVWFDERPTATTSFMRIALPVACFLVLAIFLVIHFQADEVPDYLYETAGRYFDRSGFCFVFDVISEEGICFIRAIFQNQQDQPCEGRIALQPIGQLFMKAEIEAVGIEIHCEPAAFGIAQVPLPVPISKQGTEQKFKVGASVHYPNGKGKTLRYRNGLTLRTNVDFGNAFYTGLIIAGALGGHIIWHRPASVTLRLPKEVSDQITPNIQADFKTLWKLGDPIVARVT